MFFGLENCFFILIKESQKIKLKKIQYSFLRFVKMKDNKLWLLKSFSIVSFFAKMFSNFYRMFFGVLSKHFLFYFLIIFSVSSESIQKIQSLDEIVSLDSTKEHGWEITLQKIDPIAFSDSYLKGQKNSNIQLEAYKAPGVYILPEGSIQTAFIVKKFIAPKNWKGSGLAVRLGTLTDKDKTYLNGTLIGETGDMNSDLPQAYDKIRIYQIPNGLIRKDEVNILVIEVKKYFQKEIGIEQDKTAIGDSLLIQKELLETEYIKILLLMIYTTAGVYFLFLYLRRRADHENLYYGLFTILLVLYQFLRNQIKYDLGIEFIYMKKLEYMVLATLVPLFANFIRLYFKYPKTTILKVLDGLYVSFAIFYFFSNNVEYYNFINKNLVQYGWILYLGITLNHLIRCVIAKDRDAFLILIGVLITVFAAILDTLGARNVFVFPRLVGYSFLFFILSIATILANKFVRLNEEVEELNLGLEKKVEQRTEELRLSLEQVNRLKVQQDADYFLTSLLINPLSSNKNTSEVIKTEFYTKQKKSFEFKNRTYEIGGDILISGNVKLCGKKYVVFVNGDAMGKSIQGAGGALVLGTVFNTILTRSSISLYQNKQPEKWLEEAFLELQKIFESFDGSMYISIVLGLVEENTGLLYYINAEHPWTVLYRNGVACYIEEELTLRKIGIPENEEHLVIKNFQMLPGDTIVIGSDGRDDLLVGKEGNRVVNEDQNQFLKRVEEGNADLRKVYEEIIKFGVILDDLSLLKVTYNPEDSKTKE
ncbi:SpoIIE family protein phosphatase [Leptospira interrogans]|uniref:SpoIIE family protein phosphatase n=1 Tax=Leptospira interrogans TaxID=173 RepID=UPI0002926C5F|nr:SpoIIE family protein phosphatase [Leptospira interrogans]EKO68499.1 stage II sporulation protein E [Leptospira interrogans serovar Canicola str. Fiocruz LV133]EMK21828.1 stage II sporulation protein E [Leptospira interrogans str. Kito]OLZ30894.1 stage II sporulation protein E [Leptospira interrogans serovar Canicola]POR18838.1 stage II sporulation protein E [Leptospira interrogans serovar Canicola]